MMNYNHLYYFHVAAVEGSIAAAAERLGVRQPTVSEQLRALERSLDIGLFERSTAGLKLTAAGQLAFEHTSVMFRAGERLAESLSRSDTEVPRSLRVGISGAVARATTTDFLMPLLAIEKCVPIIRNGDTLDLVRALRGSELDLVICESEPSEPVRQGFLSTIIDKTTLVVVAPPGVDPVSDWQNVALIQYRANSAYRWDVEQFLDAKGLRPRIAAESDDAQFLVEASIRGNYVSVVPRSVARDAIASGKLRVLATIEPTHSGVHALYMDGGSAELARHAVEVLIESIRLIGELPPG